MNTNAITFQADHAGTQSAWLLSAVIGFFFSFRIFIVVIAVQVFQQEPDAGVEASLVLNFLLLGFVAFSSLGPGTRTIGSILRLPPSIWVLIFLGFSGCSLLWSVAASLPAAAVFWGAMAADVAMVVLLLRNGSIEETASSLIKGYVCGACCIALLAWVFPTQSDLRLGIEDLLGTNQIGYACALAAVFAQYLILTHSKQSRWKLAAAFLAITLFRSLSKTTIIAYIAAEAVIFIWDKSISRRTKSIVILAALAVVAASWGLLESYYDVYTDAHQAESLSGRLGIWLIMLDEGLEQPWIGHGFHSVWKVIPPYGPDQFEIRHAHDELLQQFYAYGVVGIVMLIGLYRSFYRQVKKLPTSPLKTTMFALLVFVLVRGLTDTESFDLSFPLWAIVMFSLILAQSQKVHELVA
jgi:O-antigen ligase